VKRVAILGPGGAGKSELAQAISRRTGLPVVHLDRLFWRRYLESIGA
jgi:adenylate kinase family enzyme